MRALVIDGIKYLMRHKIWGTLTKEQGRLTDATYKYRTDSLGSAMKQKDCLIELHQCAPSCGSILSPSLRLAGNVPVEALAEQQQLRLCQSDNRGDKCS
jgi:hypothetical protein